MLCGEYMGATSGRALLGPAYNSNAFLGQHCIGKWVLV